MFNGIGTGQLQGQALIESYLPSKHTQTPHVTRQHLQSPNTSPPSWYQVGSPPRLAILLSSLEYKTTNTFVTNILHQSLLRGSLPNLCRRISIANCRPQLVQSSRLTASIIKFRRGDFHGTYTIEIASCKCLAIASYPFPSFLIGRMANQRLERLIQYPQVALQVGAAIES